MNDLKFIPLSDIEMISNYRDIEPVSEKDTDIIELSENIKKVGVLQPVLVRPHNYAQKAHDGKFQLIFGHRRYVACKLAGMAEIPCSIKEVANQDVLELQVTENLQRKDVHPLDEAAAFRAYMEEKKVQIEELAAKFGKSPHYIAQRLSFNTLIPELKKDFKAGILLIGHAVLLSRLQPADQKDMMASCKSSYFKGDPRYDSVEDMKETIEDAVMHELTHAGFDKKDAKLVTKAGACVTCQKRSGAGLLFPDIKEKDRCFDGACYKAKTKAHLVRQVADLIASPNPMPVVSSSLGDVDADIKKKLADNKITILEEHRDYEDSTKKTPGAILALQVGGSGAGREIAIKLKSSPKATAAKSAGVTNASSSKRTESDIDLEIGKIRDRQKRALELDLEKVHKSTLEKLEKVQDVKKPGLPHKGMVDRGIMVFLLLHKAAGYSAAREIRKSLKDIPKEPPYSPHAFQADYIKKLGALTDDDVAFMARVICLDHYGNKNLVNGIDAEDTTLRLIAEYAGVDIASIEAAQKAESDKRIERASKRVKALQEEKKALAGSKSKGRKKTPAGKTKSAPKKAKTNHLGQELTEYVLRGPAAVDESQEDEE